MTLPELEKEGYRPVKSVSSIDARDEKRILMILKKVLPHGLEVFYQCHSFNGRHWTIPIMIGTIK